MLLPITATPRSLATQLTNISNKGKQYLHRCTMGSEQA